MEFRWRADDRPLLWYLDPLSPHQLKRHEIKKKTLSESKLSVCASAKREREREREREGQRDRQRERDGALETFSLFHLILTSMLYKQLSACTLLLCV